MTAGEHLARAYLKLASIERDSGHETAAQAYEAAADLAGATCPHCGGDLVGAFPVTGVEVDTEPREEPHMWLGSPGFPLCRCLLGQDHAQEPIYERQD